MSIVIHKRALGSTVEQTIEIPGGLVYKLLTVQNQNGLPTLWYEVEPDSHMVTGTTMTIFCVGTGNPPPNDALASYIATTQDGAYVWHWYGRVITL